MDAIEPWHLNVVAILAFVLSFGWRQPLDMARSLGHSLRIFKTELKDIHTELNAAADAIRRPTLTPPTSNA